MQADSLRQPSLQTLRPCCRYQAALGFQDAAKECLLKRVRALGGAGWQASQDAFEAYAQASTALCEAYLQVHPGSRAEGSGEQRAAASNGGPVHSPGSSAVLQPQPGLACGTLRAISCGCCRA